MGRLSAAVLLAATLAAPAAATVDLDARPGEIFPVLAADPRHVRLSASYYRLDGRDLSDVALGHAWGLTRGRAGMDQSWLWEADLEAMAYSRFRVGGGVGELETVDFSAAVPLTLRRGDVSFKGALFHQSSHLGDDYIRRTGATGYRQSGEGLSALASVDLAAPLRVYGGGSFLARTVPSPDRWTGQAGVELTSDDLRLSKSLPARLFLAEDLQWHQRVRWNMDSHLVAGAKLGVSGPPSRAVRVAAGWFDGHSPFGQFYARREQWLDLSVSLEL